MGRKSAIADALRESDSPTVIGFCLAKKHVLTMFPRLAKEAMSSERPGSVHTKRARHHEHCPDSTETAK